MASSAAPLMTESEEAQLLADYGTSDPFDGAFDVDAVSKHRNILNEGSLFLTGGLAGDDDGDGVDGPGSLPSLTRLDPSMPLALMLLQYSIGGVSTAGTSLTMAEAMGKLSNESTSEAAGSSWAVGQQAASSEAADAAVRRTNQFMAEMELLLTGGRNMRQAIADAADPGEDDLAALLAAVDKELANTAYHFDPCKDPAFMQGLEAERARHLADLSPIHLPEVFEDDAELLLPAEEAEIAEAVRSRPVALALDDEEQQLFAQMAAAEAASLGRREQLAKEATQHAAVAVQAAAQETAKFIASLPVQPAGPSVVELLSAIATIETRDSAMEQDTRTQIVASQRQAETITLDRQLTAVNEAKTFSGKMVFVPLAAKIDALLPPPKSCATLEAPPMGADAPTVAVSGGAAPKPRKQPLSVVALQRRSAMKDTMLKREAAERKLMRLEEERVLSMQRTSEAQLSRIAHELQAMHAAQEEGRHQMKADEAVASADMTLRGQRARNEVLEALRNKARVQEAKATNNLLQEEQACRESVASAQGFAFDNVEKKETEERAAVERRLAALAVLLREAELLLTAQLAAEAELATAHVAKHCDATTRQAQAAFGHDQCGAAFPSYSEAAALQTSGDVVALGHGSRAAVLQRQLALRQQWSQDNRAAITGCLQGISIALNAAATHQQRAKARKGPGLADGRGTPIVEEDADETPPSACPAAADAAEGTVLNAALAKKINAQLFAAAASNPLRVPVLFRVLSAALEGVADIDYGSLRSMAVAAASRHPTPKCVRVAKFVRHLNLSGNTLGGLSFHQLFQTLPSLRTLNVSDNALGASPADVADATAAAGSSVLTSLDISANKVPDFSFLAATPHLVALTAYSNRIAQSEDLRLAPRLASLEISRNKLAELNGVSHLVTLSTVDASRNAVASIEPLQRNLLLTKVFLSNNAIAAFPARLPLVLLRQLFLSDNKLTAIPSELAWLPLLSVLHLDSNQIADISGLQHCPFLVTLRLAFNQLSNPSDLSPLGACKRLDDLAINDNPVMASSATAATQFLLAVCPALRTLNNERVDDAARPHALAAVVGAKDFGFYVAAAALWGAAIGWSSVPAVLADDLLRFASSWTAALTLSTGGGPAASKERLGFAFDRQLHLLQQEYDVITVANNRRLQNAIATEECITGRMQAAKAGSGAAAHHMSDAIAEQNHVEALQLSQAQLLALRDAPTPQLVFNRHTASALYAHRARQQREQEAKRRVADWVYRAMLCRNAVRSYRVMREASDAGRLRRYEKAARVIQPVWRGAFIRNRLRRAKVLADDDDDDLFQKVQVDDFAPALEKGAGKSLFHTALASHPQAMRFDVPQFLNGATRLEPGGAGEPQRPSSNPVRRAGEATQAGGEPRASSPPPQRSQLDEEWCSAISSQIRKKNKKMEAGRAEALRKEFITDPLKAKSKLTK